MMAKLLYKWIEAEVVSRTWYRNSNKITYSDNIAKRKRTRRR